MLKVYDYLTRRIRIRSWKDVVTIIVTGVVYVLLRFGLGKLFPNLSDKVLNVIAFIGGVIVCVTMLFALDA